MIEIVLKKTAVMLLTAAMILFTPTAFAKSAEWTYPLKATTLENRSGFLVLANRDNLLGEEFIPRNIVPVKLRGVSGPHELRREAAEALDDLFAAAEKDSFELYLKSSYRSWGTQNTMYQNRLEKYGKDDGVVAPPGSSDHQTGLAADVLNREWSQREGMTPAFGETAEAKWMEANSSAFGFIIRYLPEKQDITGIIYEPWHLRYVGLEAAKYIMDRRISLEEFTEEYQNAIIEYEQSGGDFLELCKELNAPPPAVLLDEGDGEGDSEISLFYTTP